MNALARITDPHTSHTAAALAPDFIGSHEAMIRQALQLGPATKDEIARLTGLSDVAVARRLAHMADCFPTGDTRPSKTGRPARVWGIAPEF